MTGIGEAFAKGALIKTILDVTNGFAYIQNADTNGYIESTFAKVNPPVYTANPDNLTEVISCAQAGSTIQLSAGEYDRLDLVGVNAYPEGLTIVGDKDVTMAGISITSGVENTNLNFVSDISDATLPGGLTIQDITLTNSISLRNATIDGLSIIGCHITGANKGGIHIIPSQYKDIYGKDGAASTQTRFGFQTLIVKNLLIRDCIIDGAENTQEGTTFNYANNAIYIQGSENVTIDNNTINKAAHNGIQMVQVRETPIAGKVVISRNKISDTGSASINVNQLVDGYLGIISNKLFICGQVEGHYISVSNCTNCKTYFKRTDTYGDNYYEGSIISVGNGISVTNTKSYVTSDMLPSSGVSHGWYYRYHSDGSKELFYKLPTEQRKLSEMEIVLTMPYAAGENNTFVQIVPTSYCIDVTCTYTLSMDTGELIIYLWNNTPNYDGDEFDLTLDIHILDFSGVTKSIN